MRWFKNLKKWQKGGLIGCAVGLLIACITMPAICGYSFGYSFGEWILYPHEALYLAPLTLATICFGDEGGGDLVTFVITGGWIATIVIFYGGLGALFGRFQQMVNAYWKWILTAILTLSLLFFYFMNIVG
jgi:hypothetical protein